MMAIEARFKETEVGMVPQDWEVKELQHVAFFKNGKSSPIRRDSGRFPVYGSNGILGFADTANSEENTIVIGRVGAYCGSVYFSKARCWVTDNAIIGLARADNSPHFLFYLLRRLDLNNQRGGSSQPLINQSILNSLKSAFPPSFREQVSVAKILFDLDSRIELNQQMNKTLEAMAKAIFKHWFVDFEFPDEEGEPYKSSGGEMVYDEELEKEIPKAWEVGTLEDFSELNPETWSENTAPDEINYVDLSNTKWGKIEQTQRYLWKDAPSRAQRVLRRGDTIIGTVRPGNGSFSLVAEEGLTGSTGFAVLRPRKKTYEEYVYMVSTSPENIERLSHLADGAAYPAVRPDVVLATQALLPPESMIERFAYVVNPTMTKIAYNDKESRTLGLLRDGLLPKLMSGKIRVPVEVR